MYLLIILLNQLKKKNDLDKNIKGSWFSLNRIHHGLFWFVSRDVTMTSFL